MRREIDTPRNATPPSAGRVAFVRLVLLGVAIFIAGCWQSRDGLKAPTLATQNAEVDQTIERLDRIETAMGSEIEQLERDRIAFFADEPTAWRDPFPLDTFKHAAMSCLNEPYTEGQAEPRATEAASRLGVTCAVPAVVVLDRQLDQATPSRQFGTTKLRELDALRLLRTRLQSRLRQLPAIVRRTRNYLAARRAEARQIRVEIERRQPEYSRKSFDEALENVDAYRRHLDKLETSVDAVEESIPTWSKALGTVVDALYKDLSRLGRR